MLTTAKVDRLRLVAADDVGHPVAGADRHGALVDDDQGTVHGLGDAARRIADILQVGLAAPALGRADGDERKLGIGHPVLVLAGKAQPAGLGVATDHLLQSRLVDRHLAGAEPVDPWAVHVHAGDLVAQVGKAGAGGQADIAGADHTDLSHRVLCLVLRKVELLARGAENPSAIVPPLYHGTTPGATFAPETWVQQGVCADRHLVVE